MRNILLNACLFLISIPILSCESFVEIGPPKTASVSTSVYSDDVSALAAIRGIYHEMMLAGFASGQAASITFFGGASSDELVSLTPSLDEFYNNSILPGSNNNSSLWTSAYKTIYYCNSAIEGLQKSGSVSNGTKSQLIGEAKFLRAFTHFYLLNLYGDVPLITSTDYRTNSAGSRSPFTLVMSQIIADLTEAELLLPKDFQFTANERVRATSGAAAALLARVYLYNKDWANAEAASTRVISQTNLFKMVSDLNSVFLKNSNEAIFQLMPVVSGQNTNEGMAFVPVSSTSVPPFVTIRSALISSLENGDLRKNSWTGNQTVGGTQYYYPFKYKVSKTNLAVTEYSMVLRLSEQYLIRSEARAQQGNFNDAMNDLDVIRLRASLPSIRTKIAVPSTDNLMAAIEQERRIELMGEWGHRWLDLKRWKRVDVVLTPVKSLWKSNAVLYPLPQSELNSDPNLYPQNPGY